MPRLVPAPALIDVPGGKVLLEHVGRVSTGHQTVSVAHMTVPAGWQGHPQRPEFDEVRVVLRGCLLVQHDGGIIQVDAGQSVIATAGERVRYSSSADGAEYIAVCVPAFSPDTVHRQSEE